MNKLRVLAITGIRSEYYLQRSIFEAVMNHSKLELELVVTGAHLSPLHGYTVKDIEADGFPVVDRIESLLYSTRDAGRIKSAATQLQVLAHIVDSRRPDWLLAAGDREEAMNMALCGAYMNIATAHYGGGDRVVGNVDDMVRHAISRLSHLILTYHESSRERLIRAGEQEWRVHNVGHAGLDRIRTTPAVTQEELAQLLEVPKIADRYVVVVQHSISSEIEQSGQQMRETLSAIAELGISAFVSYPNSDAGSAEIISVIDEYRGSPDIHVFKNIPDLGFINLLRRAVALVGNSSLGILESPFLNLPVINVGARQTARTHAANVAFVPHDRQLIGEQLRRILDNQDDNIRVLEDREQFGDGRTGERIADLLAETMLDVKLLNKDLSY